MHTHGKKVMVFAFLFIIIASVAVTPTFSKPEKAELIIIEYVINVETNAMQALAISQTDDSGTNPDYALLGYQWHKTANYYVNPSNKDRLSTTNVVNVITASANTWDAETSYAVFEYKGTTKSSAGIYDGRNVVSFGRYSNRQAIAVTYLWQIGGVIVETDTKLNTYYSWSLTGQSGKMDLKNIMTHEYGHWCGLADLYGDADYWLTMYGYADYGETYKQTLGLGDITGLVTVYGP